MIFKMISASCCQPEAAYRLGATDSRWVAGLLRHNTDKTQEVISQQYRLMLQEMTSMLFSDLFDYDGAAAADLMILKRAPLPKGARNSITAK